jgi:3-oxoacyl-[acyl-carrier protein] reductase
MDLDLQGKSALVTGASAGIGFAIAHRLRAEGARLAINARDPARLQRAAAELPAHAVPGDLTDAETCASVAGAAADALGGLDILVCSVGSGRSVPPGQETPAEWRRMLDINLLSATAMVHACTGALATRGGSIVCIASICGVEALGCPTAYAVAKAGLLTFVRNAARPLAARGIRINAVAPGNILFDGSTWQRKLADNPVEVQGMLAREVPLGRFGTPQEIAAAVAFLASPCSGFTTGATLVVDGGQTRS